MMVGAGWAILAWRRAWQLNFEAAQHQAVLRRRTLTARDGEGWRAMFGNTEIPTRKPPRRDDHSPESNYRRLFDRAESWTMQHQAQLIEAWNVKMRDQLSGITRDL